MERLRSQNVYFTLHATGSILSATIQDGIITHENILSRTSCPRNWLDALHEMSITEVPPTTGGDHGGTRDPANSHACQGEEHISHPGKIKCPADYAMNPHREKSLLSPPCSQSCQQEHGRKRSPSRFNSPSGTRTVNTPITNTESYAVPTRPSIPQSTSSKRPKTTRPNSSSQYPLLTETRQEEERTAKWSSLRMTKLLRLLDTLRNRPIPTVEEHNDLYDQLCRLYNGAQAPYTSSPVSILQCAGNCMDLGKLSNTSGFVYGMLTWEIFRREEDRLIFEEKVSMVLAAKQVSLLVQ
jgi:hypothetical protein